MFSHFKLSPGPPVTRSSCQIMSFHLIGLASLVHASLCAAWDRSCPRERSPSAFQVQLPVTPPALLISPGCTPSFCWVSQSPCCGKMGVLVTLPGSWPG